MNRLLLVDDDANLRFAFKRMLDGERYVVDEAPDGTTALTMLKPGTYSAVFLDVRMPGLSGMDVLSRIREADPRVPVIMITAYGGTEEAIEAVQRGAYDFVLKPFEVDHIRRLADQAVHAYTLMTRKVEVDAADTAEFADRDTLVGRSRAMQEVYKQIGRVAASDATVLILGASGTGKELVARAIYQHSPRADKPFLAVNCAAIPEGLLESELFGHEKGAFTSADHRRLGKFERAHGGTLFLDEIGDMSPGTQAKILRVLQEGTIDRVGGHAPITVDVRILAATNRDLPQLIEEGRFREDLYFRLNVFAISLPSLAERRDDLPLLVRHCLALGNSRLGKNVTDIPPETMEKLQSHPWRGNVRELENVINRALIVTAGHTLLPESISFAEEREGGSAGELAGHELLDLLFARLRQRFEESGEPMLDVLEREMLKRALGQLEGNQVQAARMLGMSRQTLRKRLEESDAQS
jgi:DNA-binding NtrC family response regulator